VKQIDILGGGRVICMIKLIHLKESSGIYIEA
jgi:hypothetical protein